MSIPVTTSPPPGFRRVEWTGRLGTVSAVLGAGADRTAAPVLLIPGMTGSKEDYFELLGPLRELGWTAAAADLPGMADSTGPAGVDPGSVDRYDLELFAQDVVGMIRDLGGGAPVHLVGHSVGGLIARAAALREPGLAATLTLYASGPGRVGQQAAASAELLIATLQQHTPERVYELKVALETAQGQPQPPPATADFLRRRWSTTTAGHFLALARIALSEIDRSDELVRLRDESGVPILVLYGSDDHTWPQEQFERYAAAAATRTVVLDGAGHSPAVEQPDRMAAALDAFWRRAGG